MNWLLIEGRTESGPYTLDQLRQLSAQGILNPQSQLRISSNNRVIQAHQVLGLFPDYRDPPPSGPAFQQAEGSPVTSHEAIIQPQSDRVTAYRESQRPTAKSRFISAALKTILLIGLSIGGFVLARNYFFPPAPPADLQAAANQKLKELDDRILRWKNEQARVERVLESLQEDRNGLLWQFQRLGYYSTSNANDTPRGQTLLQELRSLTEQTVRLSKKKEEYSLAIFQSESKLRTIERSLKTSRVLENETEIAELFAAVSAADSALAAETGASPDVEVEQEVKNLLADLQDDKTPDLEWGPDATVILLDLQPRDLQVACLGQTAMRSEGSGRYRRILVPDSLLDRELRLEFSHPKLEALQYTTKLAKGQRESLAVDMNSTDTKVRIAK